jgi:hypothetical protein
VARDDRADGRGDDDRAEALQGEVAQDDLEGEQRAADRRVVRGRDAGRSPAPQQDVQPVAGQAEAPAEDRAESRADTDQRPLAAQRPAGADRDDRRPGLQEAAAELQHAAPLRHRLDEGGRAVPADRLACDEDEEADDRPAQHRDEEPVPHRQGQGVIEDLVARSPEEPLEKPQQADERHRGEPGDHAGQGDEQEEPLLAGRAIPQRDERAPVGEHPQPVQWPPSIHPPMSL